MGYQSASLDDWREPVRPAGETEDHSLLRLVQARQRMTRAVLITLIGPTDPTQAYGATAESDRDYAEMTAAARELVAAQNAVDLDAHIRRELHPFQFPPERTNPDD